MIIVIIFTIFIMIIIIVTCYVIRWLGDRCYALVTIYAPHHHHLRNICKRVGMHFWERWMGWLNDIALNIGVRWHIGTLIKKVFIYVLVMCV